MFQVPDLQDDELVVPDEQRTEETWSPVAQLTQSRPISNYDPSIDSAETYLLQRVYLNPSALDNISQPELRLILKIAIVYGHSIRHPILRQAVVLFCLPIWSGMVTHDQLEEQRCRTRYALRARMNDPTKLDEGDLLAMVLVGRHYMLWTAARGEGNHTEARRYADGFLAIMHHVLRRFRTSGERLAFGSFWPNLASLLLTVIDTRTGNFVLLDMSRPDINVLIRMWDFSTHHPLVTPFGLDPSNVPWLWPCYIALRSLYRLTQTEESASIQDAHGTSFEAKIKARLMQLDQEKLFSVIERQLGPRRWPDATGSIITDAALNLFLYHLSRLLEWSLYPPAEALQDSTHWRIVIGTRVIDCLLRIETMIDRHNPNLIPADSIIENGENSINGGGMTPFVRLD